MRSAFASLSLLVAASLSSARSIVGPRDNNKDYTAVCKQIEGAISNVSQVFYPGSPQYTADLAHWEDSSILPSACSVEPGCEQDLSAIIKIVGSSRTPFAIKGGGHNNNQGYSSTLGVHIAMPRFKNVDYDPNNAGSVNVGAGCVWDDVYGALDPHNVSVVGARMPQVGVSGVTLAGGYSWRTNQHGLVVDNILAYRIVLPTGDIKAVTNDSDPELFFGLRGGGNNFGIVTQFTFKTFPQGPTWGGFMLFGPDHREDFIKALSYFTMNVTDPKAACIASFLTEPAQALNIFYDGEVPPPGVFDEFINLPTLFRNISTRPMLAVVQAAQVVQPYSTRGLFNTVSLLQNTPSMIKFIANESEFWGNASKSYSNTSLLSYAVEPFLDSTLEHGSDSAWPPSRKQGLLPFSMYMSWDEQKADQKFHDLAVTSATNIRNAAIAEGQDVGNSPQYPGYLISGTPIERVYGDNLPRLRALKGKVDPNNVMSLSGGWKV